MDETIAIDEQYLTDLLQRLVRTDSVNPYHDERSASEANEEKLADLLVAEFGASGIPCRKEYAAPHRPVVIAEIGAGKGPTLMLNVHMDTVGVKGLANPFSGDIREGRVYGRGATDTKGSIAAIVTAIKAIAEADVKLDGKCIFTGVCDEENEGIGAQYIASNGPGADAAIVGEPTEARLGLGQVGGVKFKITCHGKAAHGNRPHVGVSAITMAARLALELPAVARKRSHPLLGHPAFNIGRIGGGVDATTVPDYCELDCDRRILPGETVDEIFADIQELIDRLHDHDETFDARIQPPYLGPVYGFELSPDEPVVKSLSRAIQSVVGKPTDLTVTHFGGDGMYLYPKGIPTVTFGPGENAMSHTSNESIEIDLVTDAARIFLAVVLDFCNNPA